MDHQIETALKDVQQSLSKTYSLALAHGKNDDIYAKNLLSLFEKTIKIKENGKRYELALEKAKMQTTLEEFDKEYHDALESGSIQTKAKGNKEYKEFQEKLKQMKIVYHQQNTEARPSQCMTNRIENDEFVMETEICTIDPLTKRQMENPVKNRICGHRYEESSIFQAISINPKLRCPVAGCGNKQHLKKQHLVPDEEFRQQLANLQISSQGGHDNHDPLSE